MHEAIAQLSRYIDNLQIQKNKPFYLFVSNEFRCVTWSGNAEHFGYLNLAQGQDLTEQLLFLVGMEENTTPVLTLPFLDVGYNGITAQVHAIRLKVGWGIVLIDISREKNERHHYQQMAHELKLAQDSEKRLLSELQAAHKTLEEQNQALEKSSQLKTKFIGRMSHEFRTPLSSIIGFSGLARDDLDNPEKIHSDLRAIERGAHYLLNLVDNLLDQSVLENNDILIRPTACNLSSLVESLEELFQPMAHQRGLTLAWWVDSSVPSRIWIDEIRLRQVLVNILTNALKFTQTGGVTVSFEWENTQLQATIEDTGPGINPDEIPLMFEAFNQGKNAQMAKRGAGLGLSISNEIVTRLGGSLEIQSNANRGTTVLIKVESPERNNPNKDNRSLFGSKTLLVEQDQDNSRLFEIYLSSVGSKVNVANSSNECLQQCKLEKPDLVLMGLHIKPSDNETYIHAIRDGGFEGPIIALTSRDDQNTFHKAIKAGFSTVITKPIKRGEFLQALTRQLPPP